jgi:hypothetical protein
VNEQTLNLQRGFMPKQLEFLHATEDPGASEILFDGSIRAGKTQACCWWVFKQAVKHGGIYLIARNTYDQLRDSTRKVFAEGDGGLPPTCPPELVESFNRSENVLKLRRPDGGEPAEIIFRAIGDEGLGRIKNITLAAPSSTRRRSWTRATGASACTTRSSVASPTRAARGRSCSPRTRARPCIGCTGASSSRRRGSRRLGAFTSVSPMPPRS